MCHLQEELQDIACERQLQQLAVLLPAPDPGGFHQLCRAAASRGWLDWTHHHCHILPHMLTMAQPVVLHISRAAVLTCACAFSACAAAPCDRFAAGPTLPPCKVNGLSWCQTDLAANAYSWQRFLKDDMRFGVLESGHGANHDGIMADVVRARKWKVGAPGHMSFVLESCQRVPVKSVTHSLTHLHWNVCVWPWHGWNVCHAMYVCALQGLHYAHVPMLA